MNETYIDIQGNPAQPDLREGVFTTMRVKDDQLCHLAHHLARLRTAQHALRLFKFDETALSKALEHIASSTQDNVIKVVLNRQGVYLTTRSQHYPSSIHTTGVSVVTSSLELSRTTGLGLKQLEREIYTQARGSLRGNDFEVFLGYTNNHVRYIQEGSVSNVFLFKDNAVITPDNRYAGVAGTMRQYVMENFSVEMRPVLFEEVYTADALMLTNALIGAVAVCKVDDTSIGLSNSSMKTIMEAVNASC